MSRLIVLFLILFFGGAMLFFLVTSVIKPYSVAGGDAGPYMQGDIVFSASKDLYLMFGRLKVGDVVVYGRPQFDQVSGAYIGDLESISQIMAMPGQNLEPDNQAFYFDNKPVGQVVPGYFYLVRFASDKRWAVPESKISHVVWFPQK